MSHKKHILNSPDKNHKQKTFIVLGAPRGGTSMVAGVLRILGIPMGKRIEGNHEDRDFVKHKRKGEKEEVFDLIQERNSEFDVWGVKVPGLITWMKEMERFLRNPFYIIIYRNTFTSAISKVEKKDVSIDLALSVTQNFYDLILKFIKDSDKPMLFLSYENCCDHPEEMVKEISEFCQININSEILSRAVQFINPKEGYQKLA